MKKLWNKLIHQGIHDELTLSEQKRIILTNGIIIISGAVPVIAAIISMLIELLRTGSMAVSAISGPLGIAAGFLAWSFIFLNRFHKYIAARYSILAIWWVVMTAFNVVYGKPAGIYFHLTTVMIIPLAMFEKWRDIFITSGFTFILFWAIQTMFFFHEPLVETPARYVVFRYLVHLAFMIVGILLIVYYLRSQNDRSEQRLYEANDAKDKFFSILAHDLRGPIGNLAFLFDEIANDSVKLTPQLINQFKASTHNIYEMLEDLLSWAQSQKGQLELNIEYFYLKDALNKALSVVQVGARSKGVTIKTETPGFNLNSVKVHADFSAVTTVLRNLLSNAVKFTPGGGTITVRVYQKQNYFYTEIADNGIGMPLSKQKKLFNIAEKNISSPGTNNETGTGLGLVLCKEFVEANGGEIGFNSIENQGTTFYFSLPGQFSQTAETTINHDKDFKKLYYLVVEDNDLNLQTTALVLNRLGISFDHAPDGETAVQMGIANTYDGILMDIDLPRKNGVVASLEILAQKPDQFIIALTSYSRHELERKFDNLPFYGYLSKPLHQEQLVPFLNSHPKPKYSNDEITKPDLKRILVVDDSNEVHQLVKTYLNKDNYQLVSALSGKDAISKIESTDMFHLILLDIEMPEQDGFSIMKNIKQNFEQSNMSSPPVIAFSAHSSDDFLKQIKEAGFSGIIKKPFSKSSISETILEYL